jgi:hypothetical protein
MKRSNNNKNLLQEYYQRDGKQSLPIYSHERSEQDGWICTITLPDGRTFQASGRNKKEADQIAAGQVMDMISGQVIERTSELDNKQNLSKQNLSKQHKKDWRLPGCILVLIDLENSPGYDNDMWNHVQWDCSSIEAFAGKLSSHATKDLKELYPFVHKFHIVDSGHKDAVDHAISARAGAWLESMKHPDYYLHEDECIYDDAIHIVSRDRFALALVDVLRQQMPKDQYINVVHSINMDKCFSKLNENWQNFQNKRQ